MKLKRKPLILVIVGVFLLVTALVLAVTVGTNLFVPTELRKIIDESIKKNCSSCTYKIGTIKVSPLTSQIIFTNITFSGGDDKITFYEFKIERINAYVSILSLIKDIIQIEQLDITNLDVKILEGDLKSEPSADSPNDKETKFQISDINIFDSQFTYTREHARKKAPIQIQNINAQIDRAGNTPKFRTHTTVGHVTALLENSGAIELTVKSPLYSEELHVDVELNLEHLDLAKMNPYFQTNDGVVLKGQLLKGHSMVEVRKRTIHSFVEATYNQLDFTYEKTPDRSKATAFFSNLIVSAKLNKKNTQAKLQDQIKYAELKQEPDQTLISFILNGMKEAALKIATQ